MQVRKQVVIVEDSRPTRDRLSGVVENNPALDLVGTADCVRQGRLCLEEFKPDILLTDLDLPDGSGIELIKFASSSQCTESIVITVLGDEKSVIGAIQAGASGYILKDSEPADIGETILKTCEGASTISPSVARFILKQFSISSAISATTQDAEINGSESDKPPEEPSVHIASSLTKREHEVLRLIAKGFTYQEIANTLSVSVHTITTHIKHIYRKLAVSSRGQAVYEATQIGLI